MKTSLLVLIASLSFTFFSCQDFNGLNETATTDELVLKSAGIAVNDLAVESVEEEINFEADFFANSEQLLRALARFKGAKNLLGGKEGMRYMKNQCPNVSIDTAETRYPVTITLNYGDGTELNNGRVISGLVTIVITAPKGTDGGTRSITYSNCVIDSITIDGTATETFNGDNVTTRVLTTASDVTFTLADGTVIDRVGNQVREWVSGLDTPMDHSDDQISITGSTQASSAGNTWERLIIEPLVRLGDCRHHVQGIVQFSLNGEIISTLDFGNGECDNTATLTSNGETVEIELQDRMPKAKIEKRHKRGKKN